MSKAREKRKRASDARRDMLVLGIESSCDETAAAVLRLHPDGRAAILSNVVYSQIAEHAAFGGVVPEIAARAHVSRLDALLKQALKEAGVSWWRSPPVRASLAGCWWG